MSSVARMRWIGVTAMVGLLTACARSDDPSGDNPSGDDPKNAGYHELRSSQPYDVAPPISPEDYARVIAGTTEFGLSLFRHAAPTDENFFYSPASTVIALGMTYAGARGNTAVEMGKVLGSDVSQDVFAASMNQLMIDLASRNVAPHEVTPAPGQGSAGTKGLTLLPANAVWMQEGWNFAADYLDTMSVRYDAGIKVLDLMGNPRGAEHIVNQWVADQTKDKIVDLLPSGAIDGRTPLVLTNALYFYGSWEMPFLVSSTKAGTFHPSPDTDVAVSTMHDQRRMRYGEGDGYQIVDLPYDGLKLSMCIVLPAAGRFVELHDGLTETWLSAARSTMTGDTVVNLSLPKFRFTWGTRSLKEQLVALGMSDAFDSARADFTGISSAGQLYVGDVMHKAFIGIDELGTEAAAATAVVFRDASIPLMPREFTADRPFLVFIRDATGAILFAGQVVNPAL